MALDKPAGLLIHRSPLSTEKDTVVDRLKSLYENPPAPVHRLDRPTSGVLITAYNGETARLIGESFVNGEVKKVYIAIVRGFIDEEGIVDIALKKDGEGDLQEAQTFYRSLKRLEIPVANNKYESSRYSLVEVEPQTGRFHQIRRHLARIGHPIIGDTSHGDLRHNRLFGEYFDSSRLLLHAKSITFPHPHSRKIITVEAPIPEGMGRIVELF